MNNLPVTKPQKNNGPIRYTKKQNKNSLRINPLASALLLPVHFDGTYSLSRMTYRDGFSISPSIEAFRSRFLGFIFKLESSLC